MTDANVEKKKKEKERKNTKNEIYILHMSAALGK